MNIKAHLDGPQTVALFLGVTVVGSFLLGRRSKRTPVNNFYISTTPNTI